MREAVAAFLCRNDGKCYAVSNDDWLSTSGERRPAPNREITCTVNAVQQLREGGGATNLADRNAQFWARMRIAKAKSSCGVQYGHGIPYYLA